MQIARWFALAALVFSAPLMAGDSGLSFEHGDWLLVCDNTRTCRAAGYQADESDLRVSVLLTRRAGPRQAVTAEVQIDLEDESRYSASRPSAAGLSLHIDGRGLGTITPDDDSDTSGALSATQTAALLAALTRDSQIQVKTGDGTAFTLSDRGASAVLLKMDDFQGRVGTGGALVRPGSRNESTVRPALPAPIITVVRGDDTELALPRHEQAELVQAIRAVTDEGECDGLFADRDAAAEGSDPLTVWELSGGKRLVTTRCWLAAYNSGGGYWVVNADAPYEPTEVTLDGTDYAQGEISATHKGRGVGDCWAERGWAWDGHAFVPTGASWTGLCRGFAGGAWWLPTRVTELRASDARQP